MAVGIVLILGIAIVIVLMLFTQGVILSAIDDVLVSLTAKLDAVSQSITDEIARVEAIIAAGGIPQATVDALNAQLARLDGMKSALDAERPPTA